jgi:hypothetical protein
LPQYDHAVLHVATVHYKSPRWIEIQTRYLRKHISVPYRVWTSLEGIEPSYASYFDRVIEQVGGHAGKLNHLAMEILHEAPDDDLLMFLDGDAFPIADPMPVIDDALSRAPLVAVRRAEHLDEPQPHPCFCVTTVGTWRKLPGDWSTGHVWHPRADSPWTDVGANLLRQLELTETPWIELLRSNGTSLDPMYFAIYHDIVYHHVSSFRPATLSGVHDVAGGAPEPLAHPGVPLLDQAVGLLNRRRRRAWQQRTVKQRGELSQAVFARIQAGDSDWLSEIKGPGGESRELALPLASRGSS